MPQNNANKTSYLSAIAMSIACRSSSRGEKIYILGVSKVLIKAIVIITKAKLHLYAKTTRNVERALQIHDKDI